MLSLYKGRIDITHASYFNALYYSDKGEEGKIILKTETIEGGDGFVVKDSIKNKDQFKGKTIAVETATDEHFLLYKALDLYGVDPKEINIVSAPSSEAAEMFINDKADAVFTYEPFMSKAKIKGNGRILSTTKDYPGYMIDVLVGRVSVMDKRKNDFTNIIGAWYKALDFVKKNPDKAFKLMAKNQNMKPEDFKNFFNYFTFYSLKENQKYLKSNEFFHKLEEINNFLVSKGFLKVKADLKQIVDTSIVDSLK